MSAAVRLGETTRRLATVTSIIRTRRDDEARDDRHGGRNGEIEKRIEKAVTKLERATAELEKAIA